MKIFLLLTLLLVPGVSLAKLDIFVSVLPQKLFVERVGGAHVTVYALVGKGFNPATYQLTPQQTVALTEADLFIRAGMPFEESWVPRILAVTPDLVVLDMREGLDLLPMESRHEHAGHHHHMDPHVWTDPVLLQQHIVRLVSQLSKLRPELANHFTQSGNRFIEELAALDKELEKQLQDNRNNAFLVFHPAWGYFAQRYGLQQIAAEYDGKEPGAAALADLIEQSRQAGIRQIFVQPQFNSKAADVLAEAIPAKVEQADPLSENYFQAIRSFASKLPSEAN